MTRRLLLAALLLAGCRDDGPRAGTMSVMLATPRSTDGALLILIAGGPVTAARSGAHQVALDTDARGSHLLVVGDLDSGEVARIDVPDLARAAEYVTLVEQVAHRTSFVLLDPAGYSVSLRPADPH